MLNPSNKPKDAVDCWFVSQEELKQAALQVRLFCAYETPSNYYLLQSRPDGYTMEGFIGHTDTPEMYHTEIASRYSYFKDYLEQKNVYFTFDKTSLFRVNSIFPSKPLLFTLTRESNPLQKQVMINQEAIYQLLYKEKWNEIIALLYKHKDDIPAEPILQHAARTFETVFGQKVGDYPLEDKEIKYCLGLLYALHHGKFYKLNETNIKILTMQLAARSPLSEAVNYAKSYPDEALSKKIIAQFEKENLSNMRVNNELNWVEIFNRLFEAINNQGDAVTYFSGPRFITAVREVLPYHPDYYQYIAARNAQGRSTSRKIFYYDILMEMDLASRLKVVDGILLIIKSKLPDQAAAIEQLLNNQPAAKPPAAEASNLSVESLGRPVVFISYSWDDEPHQEWVLELARKLVAAGVEVILDRFNLRLGNSLPHFVEQSIAKAHRILIVFTPNYKLKADNRKGGVGYEYSIMNASLYKNQTNNEKIIPVLRKGTMVDSIPEFMQQFIHLDLSNDANFETSFTDLLREIYNEPAIKYPEIGDKPVF